MSFEATTVVRLTPDEFAQVFATHFRQAYGLRVGGVAIRSEDGALVNYETVEVIAQVKLESPVSEKPSFRDRADQLRKQRDQILATQETEGEKDGE